jgi:hypothetical protein
MVFQIFQPALIKRKNKTFFACFFENTNTNSKLFRKLQLLFQLPSLRRFCPVYIYDSWPWLSEQFPVSQTALETTFRVTGGFRKVGTSFLEKIAERFFHISQFREASRNLFWFFFTKRQLKIVKTISAHSKSPVMNFRTF